MRSLTRDRTWGEVKFDQVGAFAKRWYELIDQLADSPPNFKSEIIDGRFWIMYGSLDKTPAAIQMRKLKRLKFKWYVNDIA